MSKPRCGTNILQIVKAYARFAAEDKAGDWLTQYNGKVATEAVGVIDADVPTLFSGSDSSPSPTATPTPSPSATPSPSPSPSPTAGPPTNPSATSVPTADKAESARLKDQLQIIRDRAKHHGNVMAFFYVTYFVSIVMVMTAGLLVAITLFFIAQAG